MPHIALPEGFPGIRSLFMYSPVTAQPLNYLVQTLLHDPATSTLTPGERELIATYTSRLNECKYCATTHGAIANGLATWAPDDPAIYDAIGKQRATEGYHTKPFKVATEPVQS